jgi:D-alanyl-D-alanine dipeptidase
MSGSFDTRFDLRSFGEPIKRLRSVTIHDHGEPLVDLRDVCSEVNLRPGCLPLLRRTVALMVREVQKNLPHGCTLTVGTCLRTVEMQRGIRDHLTEKLRTEHPEWTPATLQRMLNRMVAPLDHRAPAPHTTGAAIDVGVDGPDGKPFRFSNDDDWWSCAPTYSDKLHDECRDNRMMLINVMEGAGLTNYLGEWWHWSYGDQGWALRVGRDVAYYGSVEVENAEALRVPEPKKEKE